MKCRDCGAKASHGLGWGLQTGIVFWYCEACWPRQLMRLMRLLSRFKSYRPMALEVL